MTEMSGKLIDIKKLQVLTDSQICTIQELHKQGMPIRRISECLKITRRAVSNVINRRNPPTNFHKSFTLQNTMSKDMENIIAKLVEDSPKLSPREVKHICNDFDKVANRAIQRQIDKNLYRIYGVKSSYDIADSIVNVANDLGLEYTKCYYDCKLKVVIQEKYQTIPYESNETILPPDIIDAFNEELIVQELEEEVLALQNSTLESSIRFEIMKAENETLLLDIQDLQEKKFPMELEHLIKQEIKIEPVI